MLPQCSIHRVRLLAQNLRDISVVLGKHVYDDDIGSQCAVRAEQRMYWPRMVTNQRSTS
jgi:hypothetical protein